MECSGGEAMDILALNLKRLRGRLKWWNKHVFGNIYQNLRNLEDKMIELENCLQEGWDQENLVELNKTKAEYRRAQYQEDNFWKQKSRVKWLQEGDANTAFFH